METLKVKINKEKFFEIKSGSTNKLTVGLTQAMLKKISKNESATVEELIADKKLIKKFDELDILCMFSSENIVLPIKKMTVEEDGIHFVLENEVKETDSTKTAGPVAIPTFSVDEANVVFDTPEKETKTEHPEEGYDPNEGAEMPIPADPPYIPTNNLENDESQIAERINEVVEEFCKNNKVYVVGGPRVAIHPNGVVFGTGRKLPILNDVRFYIDIEKQVFYFTYDMTEDDFINQLKDFLKKMLINNFVFIWKKRCEYKEVDGKRYLLLYYTTRRYINQTKKLL